MTVHPHYYSYSYYSIIGKSRTWFVSVLTLLALLLVLFSGQDVFSHRLTTTNLLRAPAAVMMNNNHNDNNKNNNQHQHQNQSNYQPTAPYASTIVMRKVDSTSTSSSSSTTTTTTTTVLTTDQGKTLYEHSHASNNVQQQQQQQQETKREETDSSEDDDDEYDDDGYDDDEYDDDGYDDDGKEPLPVLYAQVLEKDPSFRISPYELRFPGWKQPGWNKKRKENRVHQQDIPTGKHVCLVHVGKTAGSSIGCALGFQLHCGADNERVMSGNLPLYTTNMLHSDVNDCPDDMPYHLFVVRNPLHRAASAYIYDRRRDGDDGEPELYVQCPFWTLADLAANGLDRQNGSASEECKTRAYNAITGQAIHGEHLFYNYRYYMREAYPAKQILVIRSEHMVQDWNTAEAIVTGGPADPQLQQGSMDTVTAHDFHTRNVGEKSTEDRPLTEQERLLVCQTLCLEIQIYKLILRRAINLNNQDVQESLQELYESCPHQANVDSCPNQ